MESTTRPFFYIDLEKAMSWKEELHKRDVLGRFTTVKSGSKIVTSTGKTGTVTKVTDTHYHYKDEATGKATKVAKGNAVHHTDHKAILEADKKKKKKKASAVKGTQTKATNKANGHGKATPIVAPEAPKKGKNVAPKSTTVKDVVAPKASEAKKTSTKVPKDVHIAQENKAKRKAGVVGEDMSPNSPEAMKTKTVAVKNVGQKDPDLKADTQNQAIAKYEGMEADRDTTMDIDNMWKDKAVQRLMKRPPEKRSEADIRRLAGQITTANDKLARHVTLQMGKARGLNLLMQQNKIGDIGQSGNGEVIKQETGYYGDLLQASRTSMYETLYRIMKGSQNPKEGSSIGAHVVSRMKQKLHSDIYDLMNEIPAPHEIRSAIGDMESAKKTLQQSLGRNPEDHEIAKHLEANSKHFKEAPIMEHPTYDEKSGKWVATKNRIADPVERLRALKTYAEQQKASSLNENIGSEGEKEVTVADNVKDDALTPDEAYERKERQAELKDAIPKALENLGLNEKEKLVFMTMFGNPSNKIKKPSMTQEEVADEINANGGYEGGQKATQSWVNKHYRSAMEKLLQARQNNHPALKDLHEKFMKSLFFNMVFKALYEYDLVKSMHDWGIGLDALVTNYTRTAEAPSLLSLQKSLAPHEYIGSIVTTEDGGIHARVVEFSLADDNALYKSFNASMNSLKKSMFPHKGKSNHDVNQKALEYVKANKARYTTLSEAQHKSARAKGGTTWSEQLLLKNPGSAWITWGGKRVLIAVGDGKVLYDSANDAHREEHNNGASEDKIDFHHEQEELENNEEERGKQARADWEAHKALKERTQKKKGVDYKKEQEDFAKKNKGVSFDEEGNFKFQGDTEVTEDNKHAIDHGVQAFKEQMADMQKEWNGKSDLKTKVKDLSEHRTNHAYTNFTEDQRKEVEEANDKAYVLGKHLFNAHKEGIMDAIHKLREDKDTEAFALSLQALAGKTKSNGMATKDDMKALGGRLLKMADVDSEESQAIIARDLGDREISAGRRSAGKKMLPEGAIMVGNPLTGKVMVVRIAHGFGDGNKAGWTSKIAEAFDPDGGQHEELNSWGGLSRALGMKDNNLQETLAMYANQSETRPFMKTISDEEYNKLRSNTKLGLQEGMTHKDFKLVKEDTDRKTGEVKGRTFAMDMPDGTQNTLSVNSKGYITDPVMARLIKQDKPINNVADLHDVLKNAVGNRAWVTAHFGSDIHIGDALGHHVQLEYDGKGAPRVVGGNYDGYRFMDSNDIPKGAVDPATGEPIKALFKNGRLVDRRFSTKNAVPMKEGNAVMYKDGDKYRKGKIHSIENGKYKITDGKHHVIGMFDKSDLKPVMEEGKTNSKSGQAVVRMAKVGTHRMNTADVFNSLDPKDQKKLDKAKDLFSQALQKAGVNKAFDESGNLHKELELSDANMRELKKKLGRSKAGKALLAEFKSAYTKELELHVPDNLKAKVEAEGVNVGANGTAKISVGKFEQLRDVLGGLSIDNDARGHLEEHFNRKDRRPMAERMDSIIKNYQPSAVDENTDFGREYKAQFKPTSFLMDKDKGLYATQLEGVTHLRERGRGIVGHGMGVGKTIEGVVASMHYKAEKLANGEKPKKTLIVAPAGIQSDWGKEIGLHTNSKALYIGSAGKMKKKGADGQYMKSESGRHMFGQDGTEQEAVNSKHFLKNMESIGAEDHDFHIMSYDQFMKMRHELANSGLYDNIVIDEVHAFKNQSGKRGKSLAETTDAFKNVWGLSGTPMENDAREVYNLVDTITGGRHELGSPKEFADKFLQKDKNGKIIGVKENKAKELGDVLANIIQFRNGSDVTFTNGGKVHFPQIVGQTSEADPNPQTDFIGNMVDRNRDQQTTDYYGTKHAVFDYEPGEHTVTAKDGSDYSVKTTEPKNLTPQQQAFYDGYRELQAQHLPEAKLKELARASTTGYDTGGSVGNSDKNYLTAMQKLQKYLNAPVAKDMYVPGGSAIDSDVTGEQAVGKGKKKAEGLKPYNPVTGEGHYIVDSNGHKRYFESDGSGSYKRNADGSPKLLPPLHHNNPKADYLKSRISTYLDALATENANRKKAGKPELMPKVVVKSSYTTFGTDIVDNVIRDLQKEHPHLAYWQNKLGGKLGSGQFTGEADDREQTKTGFRGNKADYANNQGNLWATTVSPAGKEGVDFGNAHLMLMYDQDWNPQRMAQFTARVRRSDSADKAHNQVDRANAVRIESLHMPGTVEDFMFNAEDTKMGSINQVTNSTREKELAPKFGDSEAKISSSKNFTRSGKRKAGAKPNDTKVVNLPKNKPATPSLEGEKEVAIDTAKALKLVILL